MRAWGTTSPARLALFRIAAGAQRLGRSARGIVAARIAWVLALGFVSLPSPLVSIPWRGDWLDTSWMIGLVFAVRDHLQWGTQIIWTYGPLGYIENPIFITFRQWAIAVIVGVGLQISLIIALAVILSIWRAPVWTWLVVAGVLVIPGTVVGAPDLTGLLLGVCLLVIALAQTGSRSRSCAWAAVAGVVLALIALIKGTSLVCGVAIIALFVIVSVARRRAAPAATASLAFVSGFILLWVLAGQNPQNIPAYVHGMLELTGGFSAAMDSGASSTYAGLGATLVLSTGIGVVTFWKLRVRPGFYLLLLLFPVVVLAFKEGFVRSDMFHEPQFFAVVALAAALLLAMAGAPLMARGKVQTLTAAAIAVGLSASFMLGAGTPMPLLTVSATVNQYQQAWTLLTKPAAREALVDSTSATIRAAYDLPPGIYRALSKGTVDTIPVDIALVYGYGLAWDPSPILQSYSAYTPYLDDADAAHFAATTGPDYVVFADEEIDDRYPIADEPAAFRTLLQHYYPTGSGTSTLLVLSRVPKGASGRSHGATLHDNVASAAGIACGPLGAALPVPQVPGQYTFASLSVPYSVRGTVVNALYRPADLYIQFAVKGSTTGPTPMYKLVPATAADGLFVSGYIANQSDLANVFDGVVTNPIQSLTITSTNPAYYQGTVCASFATIPLNLEG